MNISLRSYALEKETSFLTFSSHFAISSSDGVLAEVSVPSTATVELGTHFSP